MSKSRFRHGRSSRYGTQLIVARVTSTACLSGKRPKYDTSSPSIVTWRAIATHIVDSRLIRRSLPSTKGRFTRLAPAQTYVERVHACVCVCVCRRRNSTVDSPAVCILAYNPRGSNRRRLGYVSLARGATG